MPSQRAVSALGTPADMSPRAVVNCSAEYVNVIGDHGAGVVSNEAVTLTRP